MLPRAEKTAKAGGKKGLKRMGTVGLVVVATSQPPSPQKKVAPEDQVEEMNEGTPRAWAPAANEL